MSRCSEPVLKASRHFDIVPSCDGTENAIFARRPSRTWGLTTCRCFLLLAVRANATIPFRAPSIHFVLVHPPPPTGPGWSVVGVKQFLKSVEEPLRHSATAICG
jgi:hypothetical protein